MKLKSNAPGIILAIALSLALALLCFCAALTYSPSTRLVAAYSPWDTRLSGLRSDRKVGTDFSFAEANVAAFSSELHLEFDDAQKDSKAIAVNGKMVTFKDIGQSRRLYAISIKPRFLLLLPSWKFGLLPISALWLLFALVTMCTASARKRTISLLPAALLAVCSYLLLSANRYDYWQRGYWLWLAVLLAVCGGLTWKYMAGQIDKRTHVAQSSKFAWIGITMILILAAVLRFNGLSFGLPGLFHPDEGRKIKIARGMVETGDLNPHYFRHPTFLLYATASFTLLDKTINGELPSFPRVVVLGRSVSAILGSLAVVALFLAIRLLYNSRAALLAALVLAASPLHAVSSRYIKEDSSMVFFTLVSFLFAAAALTTQRQVLFTLLCAFFAGVSASSKYSGMLNLAFVALIIFNFSAAKLIQLWPAALSKLQALLFVRPETAPTFPKILFLSFLAAASFALGFLLVTPYSIFDYEKFKFDFLGEKSHMERGHTVAITAASYFWTYHLKFSILPALTDPTALLALVACGYLLMRARPADIMLLCGMLLFYLPAEYVNAKPQPQPERYILPCIPFLAAALGVFISDLFNLGSRGLKAPATILVFLLTILVVYFPLKYTWQHSNAIKDDTRTQARDWLLKHARKNSNVLIDWRFYAPPQLDRHFTILEFKDKKGAKFLRGISPQVLSESPYDYMILSSLFYGRFLDPLYRAHNLSKRFKQLFTELKPIKVFSNPEFSYGFHNPDIYIFKIPKKP